MNVFSTCLKQKTVPFLSLFPPKGKKPLQPGPESASIEQNGEGMQTVPHKRARDTRIKSATRKGGVKRKPNELKMKTLLSSPNIKAYRLSRKKQTHDIETKPATGDVKQKSKRKGPVHPCVLCNGSSSLSAPIPPAPVCQANRFSSDREISKTVRAYSLSLRNRPTV